MSQDLDSYITGNYGEDQMRDEAPTVQVEPEFLCLCGNTPDAQGAHFCDREGNYTEIPPSDDEPGQCYRCDRCGIVFVGETGEIIANAKLIAAAAPQLLAALLAARDELEAYWQGDYAGRPLHEQIEVAIAKAQGFIL
jgi:hypothetical protein